MKKIILVFGMALSTLTLHAQQMQHSSMNMEMSKDMINLIKNPKVLKLDEAMRELWYSHMYWTLITVDAYYNDPKGLNAKLEYLLQNQKEIGNAIVPFYGQAAGDKLTALLTEHITMAVPVLEAAKKGDKPALDKAVKNWYGNANEIGQFLHSANPKNWPSALVEDGLKMHITQTIQYSVSILKGEYKEAFAGFEEAKHHMVYLADILTEGIVKQFPKSF